MGGNIVEAVEDLKMHFYRAAVLIYGRGILLGWLIYILYHACASYVWAGIFLKRLKILKCIFTVLPYFSIL